MANCWKCNNPLRADQVAFCPVCGAAQKPDQDPAAASAWQSRLNEVERPPNWGLSFLWLIAWMIAPLTYPALMVRANRRLKRHVRQRLASPVFASPRFTQGDEGRQVAQRLATSAGRLASVGNVGLAVLSYLIIAVMAGFVFITPASAPRQFSYGRAFEAIFEARPVRDFRYVHTAEEYEAAWKSLIYRRYSRAYATSSPRGYVLQPGTRPVQTWTEGLAEYPFNHRPYEHLLEPDRQSFSNGTRWIYRADAVVAEWDGTIPATVCFYVGLGLLYVIYTIWGLVFWARFARHARAEAVAVAYAKGDVALHDRLVPAVETRNTIRMIGIVLLSILPMFAWHLILFPILSAVMFVRHYAWERRAGVTAALGTTS